MAAITTSIKIGFYVFDKFWHEEFMLVIDRPVPRIGWNVDTESCRSGIIFKPEIQPNSEIRFVCREPNVFVGQDGTLYYVPVFQEGQEFETE